MSSSYRPYRNFRRSKPAVRTIVAKFDGKCACCAAPIKAGEMVDFYPPGTISGRNDSAIAHVGGLNGNSVRCATELCKIFQTQQKEPTL